VDVSSGKDDVTKKSTCDDAGDGEASSVEPVAPSPIRSNASRQTDPSVADQVASTAPPVDRCRHKRPPPIPKWKCALTSSDQLITQIEFPPYRGPHSLLDLVNIEIIFGHPFEAFRCVSHDAGTGTSADADIPPKKKTCQPPLKKILVPR
jgi:hypothetical protein